MMAGLITAAVTRLKVALAAASGAALVGYQVAAGAIKRTIADLFAERISVMDFMTDAQRADVRSGATTLDVAAAIQACIDYVNSLPAQNRPEVYFPAGRYLIKSGLHLYDNIALVGVRRDIGYWYAFNHSSELIAGQAMACMIDVTGSNTYIGHLGLYGNSVADYGLYTHVPVGQPRKSSATYEHLALTLFKKTGVHLFNMGLTKATSLQISDCQECGIDISNSGDSDFQQIYVNTINQDSASQVNGPSSATVYGVGIRVRDSSGNINFRGGKVEFCRIGFCLSSVDGVNITGIQFDTNRKAGIYIDSDSLTAAPDVASENAGSVTSVQIVGNRFLGGSAGTQGTSAHIFAAHTRYLTIVGNGFKRAGDAARDFATDTAQGPTYGVWLFNAELCTVVGNDLYAAATGNCLRVDSAVPATAQHTIKANSLDGSEVIATGSCRTSAEYGSMIFATDAVPVAKNTLKAWVRFDGTTTPPTIRGASYNVASVTGAAGTYNVNFSVALANTNYGVNVSAAAYNNPSDAANYKTPDSAAAVTVYTTTAGARSSNGDVTVAVYG